MNKPTIRTLPLAAALLCLLSGCVKKSDYEALQVENQNLQTRVDQANHFLEQSRSEITSLQVQMQQFTEVQAELQKARRELSESQAAYNALKAEFDQFRVQRRSAMVGRKFPLLTLDEGKVLHDAVITTVSAEEVAFRHADGFIKVALANTTDDLRWEACFDPLEAKEMAAESMLRKMREEQERPARQPAIASSAPSAYDSTRMAAEALRRQLSSLRSAMNLEYQALAAKNPNALKGDVWNFAQPEASPLINSVSGSRAVLGLSRLQYGREAVLSTLRELRSLDPSAR